MTTIAKSNKTVADKSTSKNYKNFEQFEKSMNLPNVEISDDDIMKEVRAVRYGKK
ncbi:MAG TPA: hypothetical protein P5243_10685 [Bacteroidales bacterium]|nr:hypothetical protein [Bacteroidales bacterium]HRS19961.1 hypothetical protein [Bacteroidales bacterium]